MPKSTRTKLTIPRVSALEAPKKGQRFAWDLEAPGLGVRITSHGAKSFIFERSFNGRTLRMTIGTTKAWRLSDARKEARRLQRLIDRGIDPREERRALAVADKLSGMIASEAWKAYLDAHENEWGERHMRDNRYLSRAPEGDNAGGVLWPLLQKRLGDIDASALIQWAQHALQTPSKSKINQGKGSALRQAHSRFRAFWRWACQRDEYSGAMADSS
ncbi:MAG: Arm DNA-binding domain-containing protein, partial [Planctomycetota bacterium]